MKRWLLRRLGIDRILERLAVLEHATEPESAAKLAVPADVIGEWLK